jgi:putative membrane protein
MGKRFIWIGACALVGLFVAFAGMSSASTGQNNNNNAGGGNSNSGRRRGNSNANGNMGGMSGNMSGGSMANANTGLSSSDQKFVNEAAIGGMAEVEMGRLGVERATSDDVKAFSQRLIDDHTKANADLAQVASSKGVTLPTGLDAKHQAVIDHLRTLSGADFDREFAKVGVKDHQEDIKAFQKESSGGRDADVKSFATRTLPTLQEHLRMAQDAETRMKGMKSNSNSGGGMNSNMSSNMNMNSNGNSNRRRNRNSNSNAGGNSNNGNSR